MLIVGLGVRRSVTTVIAGESRYAGLAARSEEVRAHLERSRGQAHLTLRWALVVSKERRGNEVGELLAHHRSGFGALGRGVEH